MSNPTRKSDPAVFGTLSEGVGSIVFKVERVPCPCCGAKNNGKVRLRTLRRNQEARNHG